MGEERVAAELHGNMLRVYWFLLETQKSSVGPREVQKRLRFSSPALAVYHLDKLSELGLAEKISGEYHVTKVVDVGVLKQFAKLRGILIPRNVLYATMFTTLSAFFLSQLRQINFYSIFALIFGLFGSAIFWYETLRVWRSKP